MEQEGIIRLSIFFGLFVVFAAIDVLITCYYSLLFVNIYFFSLFRINVFFTKQQ